MDYKCEILTPYFVDKTSVVKPNIYITGDDLHHIKNVMRMKEISFLQVWTTIDLPQIMPSEDIIIYGSYEVNYYKLIY